VNRHHLQRRASGRIGQRVQLGDVLVELGEVGQVAAALQLVEQSQEHLRILEIGLVLGCSRPAQRQPGALDPAPQPVAPALREAVPQRFAQAHQPGASVLGEPCKQRRPIHQLPDARVLVGARQRVEIGRGETAPGRAQHCQPGDAVGRMQQRAREHAQVLHHRAMPERLDLDRLEAQGRFAECGHDGRQVPAAAHQDGDAAVGAVAPRGLHDIQHRARLGIAIVVEQRMHLHRGSSSAGLTGSDSAKGTPPLAMSSRSGIRSRKAPLTQPTSPACERKLTLSVSGLERQAADAAAARAGIAPPRPRGSGRSTASDRPPRTACGRRPAASPR
jgi:hypothetical protein